jgi:hypothetical protein
MRDINEGFPPDSTPYTDYYGYLSDSDLEDEYSCSDEDDEEPREDRDAREPNTEEDEPKSPRGPPNSLSRVPTTTTLENPPQPSRGFDGVEDDHKLAPIFTYSYPTFPANFCRRFGNGSVRMGKVAIIHDMAEATYVKPAAG